MAPDLRGIKLEGYAETVALLKRYDTETLKIMNAEIYQTTKRTQTQARALVPAASPLSGWARPVKSGEWSRLTFNPKSIRTGIKTKLDRQRVRGNWTSKTLFLINNDAAQVSPPYNRPAIPSAIGSIVYLSAPPDPKTQVALVGVAGVGAVGSTTIQVS